MRGRGRGRGGRGGGGGGRGPRDGDSRRGDRVRFQVMSIFYQISL